ncbi:ATP-binding cassette [Thecamonas trahens ATCC 50062]|uniref:ATP-binding cassette n=1 Tax=Thecamonas trahens ATCC 50062 TaxID=461836 RepID=A0A0L0D3T2_THETB|nr:ATP-binding cassette [Thecamonas trahens ATCC 50062]KNC46969.1 ATP-binding cassette [Thecamonas trahens ATCC 50062]|eukprot:XP_013760240.1 ATP-binding cassette [Thecamonas trahens ATCC 50062]
MTTLATASIFSKLTWSWVSPLLALGSQRALTLDDMPDLDEADTTERLSADLAEAWERHRTSGGNWRLARALAEAFGPYYLKVSSAVAAESAVRLVQVICLTGLVEFVASESAKSDSVSSPVGWLWALGLSLSVIAHGVLHHVYFFGANRCGTWFRTSIASLMYAKALRVPQSALAGTSTGRIVNIISSDAARLELFATYAIFLVLAPLECIVALILMWRAIGPACLVGFATLTLLLPLQWYFSRRIGARRSITASFTDARLKLLTDVLKGMRVMKMYAWEDSFAGLIRSERAQEIHSHRVMGRFMATNLASFTVFAVLTMLTTMTTLYFQGRTLTPASVFTTLALFNMVRLSFTLFIPFAAMTGAESRVTLRRVEAFLDLPEFAVPHLLSSSPATTGDLSPSAPYLALSPTAAFSWHPATAAGSADTSDGLPSASRRFQLSHIPLTLVPDTLTVVIGSVGAGKSSLLAALLGEMAPLPAAPRLPAWTAGLRLGYVAQEAFILSATIRDNITFGTPYDDAWYATVVEAAALVPDFALWPAGDLTFIGERGVNLSGGQKARVSLARALYAAPDVYLLDDPLSAVDPKVGAHLFRRAILGLALAPPPHCPRPLSSRARRPAILLVTHQLHYAADADNVVLMVDGSIAAQGSMDALMASRHGSQVELLANHVSAGLARGTSATLSSELGPPQPSQAYVKTADDKAESLVAEERSVGSVSAATYGKYLSSMGSAPESAGVVALCLIAEAALVLPNYWLVEWSEASASDQRAPSWLYVYALVAIAAMVLSFSRAQISWAAMLTAAAKLHSDMLDAVMRSPMAFFDANPVGRILNRFSDDQGAVDSVLPWTLFDFIQVSLMSTAVLIITAIVVPWILIPLLPLVAYYAYVRSRYVKSSRELKRLDAVSKSPVFAHFASSLDGLTTIRVFDAQPVFAAGFTGKLNANTSTYLMFLATSRWLGFRLDMMSGVFVTLLAVLVVVTASSISPGFLALALVYALQLSGAFQWAVRQSSVVENLMTSVERELAYARLPPEADRETPPTLRHTLPKPWPSAGAIAFRDLTLRYTPNAPPVLNGLTASIPPGKLVGIVGRTGAGKSSLLAALFRLAEPSPRTSITIDGVVTADLGLAHLRAALAVVPQDPVLFAGTLRSNIDPFGAYPDADLWRVLEQVQLKHVVERMVVDEPAAASGLDVTIAEAGANLSVGQRQLVCLARALLKNARILVLDEASANIDLESDAILQSSLRASLRTRSTTVLAVAHRLNTIVDYDLIMVLADGRVVEFDSPAALVANPDSVFSSMVDDTGKRSAERLRAAIFASAPAPSSSTTSKPLATFDLARSAESSYTYDAYPDPESSGSDSTSASGSDSGATSDSHPHPRSAQSLVPTSTLALFP